jgi:hypothetical protein
VPVATVNVVGMVASMSAFALLSSANAGEQSSAAAAARRKTRIRVISCTSLLFE